MKLRTKMMLSFTVIVLMPVLLFVGAITVMNRFQMKKVRDNYGITDTQNIFFGNSLEVLHALNESIRREVLDAAETDSALLRDTEYLENLNETLLKRNSYLILRSGKQLVYSGLPEGKELFSRLPSFHGPEINLAEEGIYYGGEDQAFVTQTDFYLRDGTEGSVFTVTQIGKLLPEIRSMLMDIAVMTIMILGTTAAILVLWQYSSIIRPLGNLKKATREIKKGNLDYELDVTGKDEISELCMDFESMRSRLRENAEEKMQSDAEYKVLISNISHDLKTPITAIKGYCEGIIDGIASSPEKMDKYIRTIYHKVNDMDRLIDELTLYAQIDTNRIPYNFTTIPVNDYFGDCAEELRMELESQNIDLRYYNYIQDDDVSIIGDAEQLKRVINNIISNAVKYMDKARGIINFRIRDAAEYVQVEIEDNGKGISAADLPNIFERFYRADASRNSRTGGSGIGLSIVRKIIEDHGGRIWATSKEGTGTVMHFALKKSSEENHEQNTDR